MPKSTFNNLPEEKQNRLLKAGKKEFSKYSLNASSINRILQDAEIPKGSFYQYFQDKEDFYWYVMNLVIKARITTYDDLLKEFNGDLFLIEEMQLQEIINLLKDYEFSHMLRNMFLYSFHEVKQKVFDQSEVNFTLMYQIYINHKKEEYKVANEQEFHALFDMLRTLANSCIFGVVSNQYSSDYGLALYQKQVSYITDGLYSEKND
jgi:AcrR family transcriptional regulator